MPGLRSTSQAGVREDLSDLITLADQRSTAAFSLMPKESEPTNMLMEWQFDSYLEPDIAGHLSDEDRTEFENHSSRVPMAGRAQIFERAPKVGRIAQKINDVAGVGRKKEMAKCVAKALVVAKRDIECRLLSAAESGAENGETPYTTRGLFAWAVAALQTDTATAVPADALPEADAIYAGAFASITEALFTETILGAIWEVTGTMAGFQLFAGRSLKSLITSWTIFQPNTAATSQVVRTFEENETTVLRATVDLIEGDFGTIEITPTPWLRRDLDGSIAANKTIQRRSALLWDPEKTGMRFNQMPGFRPFEDKGGGPRGLIEAIGGFVVYNPKMLGAIMPTS